MRKAQSSSVAIVAIVVILILAIFLVVAYMGGFFPFSRNVNVNVENPAGQVVRDTTVREQPIIQPTQTTRESNTTIIDRTMQQNNSPPTATATANSTTATTNGSGP